MAESLTIDFSNPVPLFPLAACALLPHATIPLHIFEPRYRVMTRDALETNKLIAMATFAGNGWKDDYEGHPTIREHVCVGYVIRHDSLPDGRYNMLLQGVCRAKVRMEIPNEPYRLALLEPTETTPEMEIDLDDERRRLESLLRDDTLGELVSVAAIRKWLQHDVPTRALIDLSVLALVPGVSDRYAMLAEADPHARARWLEHFLQDTRRTVRVANRFGPSRTDDGVNLN